MNAKKILFPIILLVTCAAQIASDIYAPSLPAIAGSLQASITNVQFSMAVYMFGLAISQLFYGPLSEVWGRKAPLLIGLVILSIGHLISLFATNITILIIGRLIQGGGAGACASLWRSIFRDTFSGAELAKYGAYFSIFIVFIVPAAPTLGGYLQKYFGWRAIFAFLALYALILFLMVAIWFKETSLHHHRENLKTKFIYQSFKHVLTHPIFMGYTLCTFLCYGAFFSWFATGPILLIHNLGISPVTFGWLTFFSGGIATALGGWVNGKSVTQFGTHNMLRTGFVIMLIAGILMLLGYFLVGINLFSIIIPMTLFYFGATFIWPSAFAGAFAPFGKMAGYAGAVYGFMQISGAAVIGTIVSYLPDTNQIPLALVFIVSTILAWLIFEKIVHRKEIELQKS